jgi:predicted ATPase
VEAISHLTRGLELLKALPDTPARTQQELMLQIALGAPLMAAKGFGAPEVEKVYTQALNLCRQVGETPQVFPVIIGLWNFYNVRGELHKAHELGNQLLTLAQRVQDPLLLLEAHRLLGATLFWLGECVPARTHLEQGIALYDPRQYRSLTFPGGHPGVLCLSYVAWTLWFLGYPDQALKRSNEALTLVRELAHPFSLAFALLFSAVVYQFRREAREAQKRTDEVITLANDQGFLLWLAAGSIVRGWAIAEGGKGEEGIAQTGQGMAVFQATGARVGKPYYLGLLAETYGKLGQIEKGCSILSEAIDTAHSDGESYFEAELYRLKGELTLQQCKVQGARCKVEEAEECFRQAIDVARKQQAKSLELRAVMSLSRLWQRQGKQKDAHQMLAEIYGWFTEGFDTKDLQEAKVLLEELT